MAVLTETIPVINIDGLDLEEYVVMEVFMRKELLKPSMLQFTVRKKHLLRNESDISFELASSLIGASVAMEVTTLRRDEEMNECTETLAFDGIVFGAQTRRERIGQSAYIVITAYSKDYLLVDNPHCCSFEDMTLEEIVEQAIRPYSDEIECEINPQMTDSLPYIVQYNETTYQFLSRLAQRYGEFLYSDNGHMYFGQTPDGDTKLLYPDVDVLGFRYELNMEHTNFSHAQHDYLEYENTVEDGYGNATGELNNLTDVVFDHSHSTYKKQTLQNIHSASQETSLFSQIKSSSTVEGWGAKSRMMTCKMRTNRADICIGDRITIMEMSDEEEPIPVEHEALLVVGVEYHATIDGHFENEVYAIPSDSPYPPYGIVDLYPLCESQRARVIDNKDPEQLGRIRVQFLWQELQNTESITPWLRITQPHGGDDKGFYFIPEIGEEVMVAFENGNGEKPYVVGTLYHGKQHPGQRWYSPSNNVKAVRTRNGHTVEINDDDPGGYIRIYDYKKENYILTFSTDEKLIKLESSGNIELYANNNIVFHAKNDIRMIADNNMDMRVGVNRTTNVGENDKESIGQDQSIEIGTKQEIKIGTSQEVEIANDQAVSIKGNQYVDVSENVSHTSKNFRNAVKELINMTSKNHEQKADSKMDIDGGREMNVTAKNVKIN